eukprot:gene30287-37837_t
MASRQRKGADVARCFTTLGLPKYAKEAEVRRAYRNLVRLEHPDKGGDVDKFKEIQRAYDTLVSKDGKEDHPPVAKELRQ